MRYAFFILAAGALLWGCADQQPAQSDFVHYGAPPILNGMAPSGVGGFSGSGSWGAGNQDFRTPGSDQLKGFRGF